MAFSTLPTYDFLSTLTSIFENKSIPSPQSNVQTNDLKSQLINVCNDDSISDSEKRSQVEDLISQLGDLSPIQKTASSPSLEKKWNL